MNCWRREVAMSSIDHNELFEQYYQNEYDFNTASLSLDEIAEIKKLAREKRVDYNLAPMGTGVFNWILKENSNIRFERVAFDSEKIDGMLYVPTTGKERAYIILNSKKPLINQIFTAAHEYYHYIKDYQKFKEMPYIFDYKCKAGVTVNGERGYLRDITGNRRFWIIKLHQKKQKKTWNFTPGFRAQFWAEAKEIWKAGEKVVLRR